MKSKKITNENVQVIPETVEAVNEAETASDELAAALFENAENAESVENAGNAENPQEAAEKKKSVIRNIIDAIGKFDYAALIMTLLGAYLSAMAYAVLMPSAPAVPPPAERLLTASMIRAPSLPVAPSSSTLSPDAYVTIDTRSLGLSCSVSRPNAF